MATGEPVWAFATRFPRQGDWTEADYLSLPEGYPRVELSNGSLEVLPRPTDHHQALLTAVLLALAAYAKQVKGWARPAGLRIRLADGRFREPDVAFLSAARGALRGERFWTGADLVVEIVSDGPDDRTRDYVVKRAEYARAQIAEYWIVDPYEERITVLCLDGDAYREHGVLGRGDTLSSPSLDGLTLAVDDVLGAD